ncbi:MAG: ABC transporter permease [Acidimicrobiia bacterium]|nr:ABC transporter permease [Acidimicrobiia bacterium]MBA3802333.1 ABC transporter permease [Acidimicrobiia bacterium]
MSEANPRRAGATATDEFSARQQEVDEARASEEGQEGRPYELRAATQGIFGELRADKAGLLAAIFLTIVLIGAVFAPWLAPQGPVEGNPSTASIDPIWAGGTWAHVLGTDAQGYDVLSRLMYGARTTLLIGFAVVLIAGLFGVTLGLIAGYRGGRTDRWLMRWVDVQVAFPGLLIALIMIAVLGPSKTSLIFVLSFNGWMVYARMTRGVVLAAKERPYVEAAEMVGCRPRRVMFVHILPNLTSSLVTLAVLEFARIILAEATLSFLGLGLQFPEVSLGVMANGGRDSFFSLPRLAIIPGVVITLIVLAVNFLASWLRVVFDPQEREKRFAAGATTAATTVEGAAT